MARDKDDKTILIEDAELIYRNFRGLPGTFNAEGDRGFNVMIDPDVAEQLEEDGWNIKYLKPRNEEEVDPNEPLQAHMEVKVKYTNKPPRIVVNIGKNRVEIDESTVGTLDHVDIERVDLIINPYEWDIGGKQGIKGYLKTMFLWVHQDYLEEKYASLEDLPSRAGRIDGDD